MALGWGIIGIGSHADRYVAPAITGAADTELVAVCSRSLGRANAFAAKHGAGRAYDSLEQMLADDELDVLYIATPNNLHAVQTVQAATAGKHVFCEKPMALSVADCRMMIDACNRNKVKLGIDFQNRFHPAHVEAHRLIQSGEAGEVTVVKAQYCHGRARGVWRGWRNQPEVAGAGALVGTGIHPIDLLCYLLESEIEEVFAVTDEEPPRYPVDDMVYATMKFRNGAYGSVISGLLVPRSDNDVVIYGSKAKIVCKGTVGMPMQGELLVEGDAVSVRMSFPVADPVPALYLRAVESFSRSIQDDTEPLSSAAAGLEMVRVANAIIESSRKRRAVKIERDD